MNIDWSKAPEGATHFGPETDTHCESWYRVEGGEIISFVPTGDYPFVLTKAQAGSAYYHATDELIEPWTGEGLPPVGTVCECMLIGGSDEWVLCEVIAHKDNQAVCWVDCNRITASTGPRIRTIRTPEQIAAEEREKSVQELMGLWLHGDHDECLEDAMARIYDSGFRKPPL